MGKKKKFIDKKKAATFQLISRDSSDPNYSEDPSGDRVFVRVDGNSDKPFFDEHDNDDSNGIFDDAPEDYSGDEIDGRDSSFEKQTAVEGRLPGGSSLPDHVRREIVELGFPDDGYNYLSHLREIRVAGGGSSFYQNPKARLDQLPRDIKVKFFILYLKFLYFPLLFYVVLYMCVFLCMMVFICLYCHITVSIRLPHQHTFN